MIGDVRDANSQRRNSTKHNTLLLFISPNLFTSLCSEAKKIAHRHIQKRRADWDLVKIQIMEEILRTKLSQYAYVKKK